jgi:hypothetical protein
MYIKELLLFLLKAAKIEYFTALDIPFMMGKEESLYFSLNDDI